MFEASCYRMAGSFTKFDVPSKIETSASTLDLCVKAITLGEILFDLEIDRSLHGSDW